MCLHSLKPHPLLCWRSIRSQCRLDTYRCNKNIKNKLMVKSKHRGAICTTVSQVPFPVLGAPYLNVLFVKINMKSEFKKNTYKPILREVTGSISSSGPISFTPWYSDPWCSRNVRTCCSWCDSCKRKYSEVLSLIMYWI